MSKYCIGDIVSLRTHPFSELSNNIIISGEHLMTPPTMIITEIISRVSEDDENREDRYKCIWFSSKKNNFPSYWFSESDLKPVKETASKQVIPIVTGSLVSLKNLRIEMGKRRSYLQIDSKLSGGKTQTSSISAHMIFISPVMLVVDINNHDSTKLPKGHSQKDKIFPSQIVKCKYYNAAQEKYSEEFLPIEVLSALESVPDKLIESLEQIIEQSSYLLTKNSILKPINTYCKSGIYFIGAYDSIRMQNRDIELANLTEFKIIKSPFIDTAPSYSIVIEQGIKLLKQGLNVEDFVKAAIADPEKKFLFIKYSDKYGNHTQRTIDNYEIIFGLGEDSTQIEYLRAYCNIRKAIRHFRINGILEVSKMALNYPVRTS